MLYHSYLSSISSISPSHPIHYSHIPIILTNYSHNSLLQLLQLLQLLIFDKDSEGGDDRVDQDGEAEDEVDRTEAVEAKRLDEGSIAEGLSVLAKTADGLGHAYPCIFFSFVVNSVCFSPSSLVFSLFIEFLLYLEDTFVWRLKTKRLLISQLWKTNTFTYATWIFQRIRFLTWDHLLLSSTSYQLILATISSKLSRDSRRVSVPSPVHSPFINNLHRTISTNFEYGTQQTITTEFPRTPNAEGPQLKQYPFFSFLLFLFVLFCSFLFFNNDISIDGRR